MAVYFLETSTLVKRYVQETGTAWVRNLTAPSARHALYIAQVAGVETVAAITLRRRRGNTTPQDAAAALIAFRRDFQRDYSSVGITSAVVSAAMDLAENHGLRGYDAVQLAVALQIQSRVSAVGSSVLTFVSADQALNAAATAEGLSVDDPNTH